MTEQIETVLKGFFIGLRQHISVWRSLLNQAERPVEAFCNQSEQLHLVLRAEWREDILDEFPDLESRLLYKIRSGIESELKILVNIRNELKHQNEKLMKQMDLIERSTFNEDLNLLTSKGFVSPPFYTLKSYAEDACRYFMSLIISINCALHVLNYENRNCVAMIKDAFSIQRLNSDKLDGVLRDTINFVEDIGS